MSDALTYRGKYIVLTVRDDRLQYHVASPFSKGYDSLTAVRQAIDTEIDGQLDARSAYYLRHITAAAYITLQAKLTLAACVD